MAEVEVEDLENMDESGSEPPKPRRGRPPKPKIDENAEHLELIDTLRSYPEDAWKTKLFMYLWRQYPIIDRKATGNDFNLRKYTQPIDTQDILEEFGSGIYKLRLNSYDPLNGQTIKLGEQIIRLMNEKYPPVIPLAEWVDDPRNKDWAWCKPMLVAKQNDALKVANSGNETAQVVQAVTDAIQKLRPEANDDEKKTLLTMVLSQMQSTNAQMVDLAKRSSSELLPVVNAIIAMSQKNSGSDLAGIAALIAAVKPKSDDSMMTLLMTLLTEERKEAREANQRLMERLDRRNSAPRGEGGTDWAGIARDIGGQLFQTLDSGFKVWLAVQSQKGSQMRPGMRPPIQPAPGLPPASPEQANAPMTQQDQENALKALDAQFGPMFDAIVPEMMEIFRDPHGVGMEFRDDVFLVQFGRFAYQQVQRLDVRTIVGVIEMRKQTAPPNIQRELQDFQPPEKVMQFITEFLSNTPWEPPAEESQEEGLHDTNGF